MYLTRTIDGGAEMESEADSQDTEPGAESMKARKRRRAVVFEGNTDYRHTRGERAGRTAIEYTPGRDHQSGNYSNTTYKESHANRGKQLHPASCPPRSFVMDTGRIVHSLRTRYCTGPAGSIRNQLVIQIRQAYLSAY